MRYQPRVARATLALSSLLAFGLLPGSRQPARGEAEPVAVTVAVPPFEQIAERKDDEYLKAAFAEHLTTTLARVRGLRVVERSHLKRILDELKLQQSGLVDDAGAAKLGKLAGAKQVVAGSFTRAGNAMRVTCRLVEAESGTVDAAHTAIVTRDLAKAEAIFDLLDAVSDAVLKSFNIEVSTQEKQRIEQVSHSTGNADALEFYSQAREKYLQMTLAGWKEAADLFRKAIDRDAKYALAWAGLAESLRLWGFQEEQRGDDPGERYRRALEAAKKAVELEPNLPEAHRAIAAVYMHKVEGVPKDERRKRCEEAARKAIALNERDPEAHLWLWEALGRPVQGEGFRHVEKALELNPNLMVAHNDLGNRYAGLQRFDDAMRHCKKAVELAPRSAVAQGNLAGCYLAQDKLAEAEDALIKALEIEPGSPPILFCRGLLREKQQRGMEALQIYQKLVQEHPRYPDTWAQLGVLFALMGDRQNAVQALRKYIDLAQDIMGAEDSVAQVRKVLQQIGADDEE